jgi:aminoglycoside 3-N-acetyltransferase
MLPGVVRSQHPTHSLALSGKDAATIAAGHENCETPCGQGTPYQKLIALDAAVLMFGVSLDSYTFFHTAEDAASVPYLYETNPYVLRLREDDGRVGEFRMWRQNMAVIRRFADMALWLARTSLLQRYRLGKGELLWIPSSRSVHEAVIAKLTSNPRYLVRESNPQDQSIPV